MADAFAAGCALTTQFIEKRPDVAKRFTEGWAKAIEYIKTNRKEAQKHLAKNTLTPANLVEIVPPLGYIMTKDMSQEAARLSADVRRLRPRHRRDSAQKIDVTEYLKSF